MEDPIILDCFFTYRSSALTERASKPDPIMEMEIDKHFVLYYPEFYDLLFIDSSGFVFHSIRQESDYHVNLFHTGQELSRLATHLQAGPTTSIVDFEYYDPSQEPASFHVIPVGRRGRCTGWLVLQHSVNGINAILTDRAGLARTGEVYLVNKDGLLLTDSRFTRDNAILRERLPGTTTDHLIADSVENTLVLDYRGVRVFSSHEGFDLLGLPWIIYAEIDEAEVITNYYLGHVKDLLDALVFHVAMAPRATPMKPAGGAPPVKVDMNEYALARHDETINTRGVASCTAVAICYPGRFAYLAHIGPRDLVYAERNAGRTSPGRPPDILADLIGRVKHFELYPSELRNLKITIIATHDEAIGGIIGKLVDEGIDLAQISIALNFSVGCANVTADPADSSLVIEWVNSPGSHESVFEDASNLEDLGSIVKTITGYNGKTAKQQRLAEL